AWANAAVYVPLDHLRTNTIGASVSFVHRDLSGWLEVGCDIRRPVNTVDFATFGIGTERRTLFRWTLGVRYQGLRDTTIALENVYEKTPHQLCRLFRGLDAANLIFCFDAGHFNAFSNRSFEQWMEELGPFLGQLHLHDNSGVADEHLPVGDGNFPFARLFSTVEEMKVRPIITLEPHTEENFWKTLKNLETIGLPA
ncbi:MAG TPA: TIM barrel protein, partial [Syntrophales bacterium]|nr:TIM barrel protein [Syntrophales bacterium]